MSQDPLDRELNGPNEPTQLQIDSTRIRELSTELAASLLRNQPLVNRIEALETALLQMIKGCHMCLGRGTVSSWNVNSEPPLISCPDCAFARATLRGTA